MAVLMVTHDYEVIRKFPARTVQIMDGELHDIKIL